MVHCLDKVVGQYRNSVPVLTKKISYIRKLDFSSSLLPLHYIPFITSDILSLVKQMSCLCMFMSYVVLQSMRMMGLVTLYMPDKAHISS